MQHGVLLYIRAGDDGNIRRLKAEVHAYPRIDFLMRFEIERSDVRVECVEHWPSARSQAPAPALRVTPRSTYSTTSPAS